MENEICMLCHEPFEEHVFLQCKHPICFECLRPQLPFEPYYNLSNNFIISPLEVLLGRNAKKVTNICCPVCSGKLMLIVAHGNSKPGSDLQLPVINSALREDQQQYIPDEMFQWVFQFLVAKELFTKICFTCNRMDKIMCTALLSLHCQGLRINGVKFAHEVLPNETQLQELNLTLNNIGDNEATQIATVFPLLQQLQVLNLSWNRIGDAGAVIIANSVKHLKQLQMLDISWNPIEDSGITAISSATKELKNFQLMEISEKNCKKVHEHVLEVFSQNGTKLDLISCDIDDARAIALAKMLPYLTQLQEIRFNNNQIGDPGATVIASSIINMMQLQEIRFNNNQIGYSGALALANSIINITQLKKLCLGGNQIQDSGAIAIVNTITNLTQLQYFDLSFNEIGDIGATAIANAITNLTQLQELYLGGNQIGDTGAIAITNLIHLKCLYLYNNNISYTVKQQLRQTNKITNCYI